MNYNTTTSSSQQPYPSRVERVLDIFGRGTVLIPTKFGTKQPLQKEYTRFGIEKMSDSEHLTLLENNNISILTGEPSGDLISIDFDSDEAYEQFQAHNPSLCETCRTMGARGRNLWFRLSGSYPQGMKKLSGREGAPIGEWRAGGCITVVAGNHPEGMAYRIDNQFPVRSILFEEICWPEGWNGITEKADPFDKLTEKHGPPLHVGKGGGVQINEEFIAAWILAENHLVFAKENERFYMYDEEAGIWNSQSPREVDRLIHNYITRLASHNDLERVHFQNRSHNATSIRHHLASLTSQTFFTPFRAAGWFAFPANNAVVVIAPETSENSKCVGTIPFGPSFRFVAKSEVDFVPGATCPRFLEQLLGPVLSPDDILTLQKMVGLILIDKNNTQQILLMEGPGGLGKSTFVNTLNELLGSGFVTELRTRHLDSRFETSRYVGKRLLFGQDAPSDFLNTKGASLLKSLTGGDIISTETKGANDFSELRGCFHVVITSNTPLLVRLEADADAWRRRLIIIHFHHPAERPSKIIRRFDDVLIGEEGPGILNWALEGALLALADISKTGSIRLTPEQSRRVDDRVRASDTVDVFVQERLRVFPEGEVASQTLREAYLSFCDEHEFAAEAQRLFFTQVRSVMETRWGGHVQPTENITLNGKRHRGYRGVGLRESETIGPSV